jgi:CDP-diacylglycerol--serine O-phosphatidyltransferase
VLAYSYLGSPLVMPIVSPLARLVPDRLKDALS